MGGLSLLLLRGHERTSAILAAIPFFLLACLSQPKRTMVEGKEVVEPVVFGHVMPMWAVFAVFGIAFVALWRGLHRFLDRRWPETETILVDKVHARPGGGFIAWKGDDPEAGSPLDYISPKLRTTLDYLQAEEPAPIRFMLLGGEAAEAELAEFRNEMARWLDDAPEEALRDLIPAARAMGKPLDATVAERLVDAAYARSIPTLGELRSFADEMDSDDLRDFTESTGDSTKEA